MMLALLSVWPRWPPSPAGICICSEVPVLGDEFHSSHAATSRLQTHRNEWNRRDSDCGGRNILWGTQQGHLPGAMWWLRRFYTVAFVCLFRLESLPGGAAGQPSVVNIPYLLFYYPLTSLADFYFFLLLSQKSVVVIVTDGPCWLRSSLLSINSRSNRLWLLYFYSFLCPCLWWDRNNNSPCRIVVVYLCTNTILVLQKASGPW